MQLGLSHLVARQAVSGKFVVIGWGESRQTVAADDDARYQPSNRVVSGFGVSLKPVLVKLA
jgi:hypothetical protein